MGKFTRIAWTNSTLNLSWGCSKVSAGCENCYMFRLSRKFGRNPEMVTLFDMKRSEDKIKSMGNLIFVNSMSDTFHESIPDERISEWMKMFERHPDHQFQILTKRINRARQYVSRHGKLPRNVWLGTSVEDQHHIFRIRTLQSIPHDSVKFISFEPLLGPIISPDLKGIDWILIGGESDDIAPRIMDIKWAQDLIDYTREHYSECAVFFKQAGGRGGDGAGGCIINEKEIKEYPLCVASYGL